MRKLMLLLMVLVLGSVTFFKSASAQDKEKRFRGGMSISTIGEKGINDCADVKMTIGDGETVRSQVTQSLPRGAVQTLEVRSSKNGGIHVQGWNRDEYSITACMAAGADDANQAKALLDQLKLSVANGKVTVDGPASQQWFAYLIIQAPNGAVLDLAGVNGPVGVSDFSGTIAARNQNGPISFHDVGGQVRANVQNGPLTVAGSSGDFKVSAQNGPLTVQLDGVQWQGDFEGSTQNGPLNLSLPESFMSPVRVDASKHSPVQCKAVQCQQSVRTWDKPSVIQFGDQTNPVIRLSTINGPVTISSAK
jgi:hypothetical protein